MADWLVIEDYSSTPLHFNAGTIIADSQYDIAGLRNQGLALVEWKDPLKTDFAPILAGYLAYRAQKPASTAVDADLSALLGAYTEGKPGTGGGEANTSSNAGGGASLALPKNGVDLPFRTLTSDDGSVGIVQDAGTLDLSVPTGGEANTSSNEGSGVGLAMAKAGDNLPFKTLISSGNSLIIDGSDPDTIDLMVPFAGQSGQAQLSFGAAAGGPNADITLAGQALQALPPAGQSPAPFTTVLTLESDQWEKVPGTEGAIRYVGFEDGKIFAIHGHLTFAREDSSPDKDLFLYPNVAAAPVAGTAIPAARQGVHAANGDETYSIAISTLISANIGDRLELWVRAEGGGAPFVFRVIGYSLTVVPIAPGG